MDVSVQIFEVQKKELDDQSRPSPYNEYIKSNIFLDQTIVDEMLKELNLPDNLSKFKYENKTFVKERNMYWLSYEDLCSVIEWLQRFHDNASEDVQLQFLHSINTEYGKGVLYYLKEDIERRWNLYGNYVFMRIG